MIPIGVHHQGSNGVKFQFAKQIVVHGRPRNPDTSVSWQMAGQDAVQVQVNGFEGDLDYVNVEWAVPVTTSITVNAGAGGIKSLAGGTVPPGVYVVL